MDRIDAQPLQRSLLFSWDIAMGASQGLTAACQPCHTCELQSSYSKISHSRAPRGSKSPWFLRCQGLSWMQKPILPFHTFSASWLPCDFLSANLCQLRTHRTWLRMGLTRGLIYLDHVGSCQAIQNPAAMTILLSQAKSCRVKVNFNRRRIGRRRRRI